MRPPEPMPQSNDYQQVRALARDIESSSDGPERTALIAEIARHAALIPDGYQQANALVAAIKTMSGAGLGQRATDLIDMAQALVPTLPTADRRIEVTTALVRATVATRYYRRAEDLARGLDDPDAREQALAALVTALTDQKAYSRAEARAMLVTDSLRRGRLLYQLTVALDADGQCRPAKVLRLVDRIDHPYWRAQALLALADVAVTRGREAEAKKRAQQARAAAAELIQDEPSSNKILTGVATILARTGDHDTARRLAHAITDQEQHAYAVTELAKLAASAGRADRVGSLTRSIDNQYFRGKAISMLAPLLASRHRRAGPPAGRGTAGSRLARTLPDRAGTRAGPGRR